MVIIYKQNLLTYIKDFEGAPWLVLKTSHYVFHYFKDSLTAKEIEKIVKSQEDAFRKIISTLGVEEPGKKINYYLYPDAETKNKLMGDGWYAQSIYNDFCIHAIYSEKDRVIGPHEDTHLLTLPWGIAIGFFQEGLAEYMVGHDWYGGSHDKRVQKALEKGILPPFQSMFSHQAWLDTPDEHAIDFYAYAGSIVKFLIEKYGLVKFKKFYEMLNRDESSSENVAIFQKVYDISPARIEQDWQMTIRTMV